jgi:hypothetical protein
MPDSIEEKIKGLQRFFPLQESQVDDFLNAVVELVDTKDPRVIRPILLLADDHCPLGGVMAQMFTCLEDFPSDVYVPELLDALPEFRVQSPFWCEQEIRKLSDSSKIWQNIPIQETALRDLTSEECQLRETRRNQLEQMLAEQIPVLADFAESLGLEDPSILSQNPEKFLPHLEAFLRDPTIQSEDWAWIVSRVGDFVGNYFIQRFAGEWFLDEIPGSRFFLRAVVGRFRLLTCPHAMVDPFQVAVEFLGTPSPRSLSALLDEVEKELHCVEQLPQVAS